MDVDRFILDDEIAYVLIPDAIRRYCGPRQYSHFEEHSDGKDISWMEYPLNIKENLDRIILMWYNN